MKEKTGVTESELLKIINDGIQAGFVEVADRKVEIPSWARTVRVTAVERAPPPNSETWNWRADLPPAKPDEEPMGEVRELIDALRSEYELF